MSYIVTGGAGFIGSNMVRKLNDHGINDIIIIDTYSNNKMANLQGLKFRDFMDYKDGLASINSYLDTIENPKGFFHIGANSNVLIYDEKLMMNENFEFSKMYCEYAHRHNIPFIYASSSAVYGNSKDFSISLEKETPHNIYGWSKLFFDKYVTGNADRFTNKVIGFRFFNVFGWNEFYKNETACLPYRFYSFIRDKGFIDLFSNHIERDYVWVEDLTEVLYQTVFIENIPNGIYNLGGMHPVTHRRVAEIVIEEFMAKGKLPKCYDLNRYIKIIEMPEELRKHFQYYTFAQGQLPFITEITKGNEEKIRNYVDNLIDKEV